MKRPRRAAFLQVIAPDRLSAAVGQSLAEEFHRPSPLAAEVRIVILNPEIVGSSFVRTWHGQPVFADSLTASITLVAGFVLRRGWMVAEKNAGGSRLNLLLGMLAWKRVEHKL